MANLLETIKEIARDIKALKSSKSATYKEIQIGEIKRSEMTLDSGVGNNSIYQITFPKPFVGDPKLDWSIRTAGKAVAIYTVFDLTKTGFKFSQNYHGADEPILTYRAYTQ